MQVGWSPNSNQWLENSPMNTKSTFFKRHSLTLYLILTPLISLVIALFLPLPTVAIALLLLLVPSTLAVLLTALAEGREGVAVLLKKLFQWRVSLKWYAVALALPIGIILFADVLAFLLGWAPTVQFRVPPASQLISNFILIALIAVLEELGWRGYALPRLLVHRSPLSSAVIIGFLWGILHIGIGLVDGRPWIPTFLIPFGISIVMTWLFVHTRASLTMAILFHFAIDYSPQFLLYGLTTEQNTWAQAVSSLVVALVVILLFGTNLQRNPANVQVAADTG
jgi:membrane protease YdiL (CAAX protease family)